MTSEQEMRNDSSYDEMLSDNSFHIKDSNEMTGKETDTRGLQVAAKREAPIQDEGKE